MGLWEEEDYGVLADRACWAMFAVTAVVVGLRIFCRAYYARVRGQGLGPDDYITLACLAVFLATCILVTLGSHYGLGRRMATLPPENIVPALRYNVIISSVLIWQFSLPKFAMISILQRILSPGIKTVIAFWFLGLSSQACILATSVWWFKQCDPVEYGWDRSIPGGTCAPVSVMANLGYFTSAYSAFLDVFFALYPIPFIMRLNMPLKTRIAVATALGLSVLACVVSIYKLAIFGQIFEILAFDPTYPVPYLDILGVAEGCILMVCASLPTLGPLYRAARGNLTTGAGDSAQLSANQFGNSNGGTRNWDSVKGHKLESDAEGESLHLRPSFDAIPLVTTAKTTGHVEEMGIRKTMEVSLSSEAFNGQKRHKGAIAV
ncbi:hypothetical protein N657DRAFT_642403 [Parathielavia appendiculata]|uniref:Rhodopsin domain-containing protein n=1 Tax=Parathielavia appendiculata TaxID=2587402 RepID=A0AAN6U479_9PEZI|nr:hypothetical protein N657DRAFT_642403 [Parathielavia appendiculata]